MNLYYRARWGFFLLLITIKIALVTATPVAAADGISNIKRSHSLFSQDVQPMLDGVLDEDVWKHATIIELNYENEPGHGTPAPVKTIAYLYEDGENLHVAVKAFDPNPQAIQASLRPRDDIGMDDNVGIIVDTFNDQRSGFGFFVNALGIQSDMSRQEAEDSDDSEDLSWDATWSSAGQINEDGYVIEMSIPFRVLRFPAAGEEMIWNLAVQRTYPRENRIEMANFRKDRNRKCSICQYEPLVGFKDIQINKNFQITPTLTLGRSDKKDVSSNRGWQQGDIETEVGVDLRWSVTENTVVNATLNPDFSQVEADAVQLDINNTDALFFDEKRSFFLDGADYFTTPQFNFVHTRNIADPDYGLKLTGKSGSHRYGVMIANDNRTDFLIPGNQGSDLADTNLKSTIAVARYRLDLGKQSNIGALMTSRIGDGYKNQLLSIDGVYWLNDSNSVNYQLAHADTRNPLQVQTTFNLDDEQSGEAYLLSFDHETKETSFQAEAKRVDKGFRADLGFQEEADYQQLSLGGSRSWFTNGKGWLNEHQLYVDWDKSWDLNNVLLEDEWEASSTLTGKRQSTLELGVIHRNSLFQNEYFKEKQVSFFGEITPVNEFEFSTYVYYGDKIDFTNAQLGREFGVDTRSSWQVNQHFQIEAEYDYSSLKVDGGELFNAGVIDAKIIWQFDSRNQLRFIIQHTDIERDLSLYSDPLDFDAEEQLVTTQLLYSYKVNPQTLFFFGYSDRGIQNDNQADLTRTDRTVFAKFSYGWQH